MMFINLHISSTVRNVNDVYLLDCGHGKSINVVLFKQYFSWTLFENEEPYFLGFEFLTQEKSRFDKIDLLKYS